MVGSPTLFPSDVQLASLVDECQKENNHPLFADDIESMLPWASMTTSALCEFVTFMTTHIEDHDLVAPFLLAEWAEDEGTDSSLLHDIANHFQPASHGGQKTVYIVSPFDQVVKALAICSITDFSRLLSKCVTVEVDAKAMAVADTRGGQDRRDGRALAISRRGEHSRLSHSIRRETLPMHLASENAKSLFVRSRT